MLLLVFHFVYVRAHASCDATEPTGYEKLMKSLMHGYEKNHGKSNVLWIVLGGNRLKRN